MRGAIVHIPRSTSSWHQRGLLVMEWLDRVNVRESDSIEALRFERAGLADA
jgi:hypothetical protein